MCTLSSGLPNTNPPIGWNREMGNYYIFLCGYKHDIDYHLRQLAVMPSLRISGSLP